MATRKEARRRSLLQILALIVVAAVIVAVVVIVQAWMRNRPDPQPQDTAVTVSVGDREQEVYPYLVAEPGVEAEESEVPTIEVGADETLTITVPEHVYDHDWSAVLIYSDPAANDEIIHGGYDADSIEVPGSVDPIGEEKDRPVLAVVEIQTVLIGTDSKGAETPYTTVWSIATQNA